MHVLTAICVSASLLCSCFFSVVLPQHAHYPPYCPSTTPSPAPHRTFHFPISSAPQVLPHTSAPFARRGHGLPIRGHATKLTELSHLTSLSLADNKFHAADWQALSGAMGPRLNVGEQNALTQASLQATRDCCLCMRPCNTSVNRRVATLLHHSKAARSAQVPK